MLILSGSISISGFKGSPLQGVWSGSARLPSNRTLV